MVYSDAAAHALLKESLQKHSMNPNEYKILYLLKLASICPSELLQSWRLSIKPNGTDDGVHLVSLDAGCSFIAQTSRICFNGPETMFS